MTEPKQKDTQEELKEIMSGMSWEKLQSVFDLATEFLSQKWLILVTDILSLQIKLFSKETAEAEMELKDNVVLFAVSDPDYKNIISFMTNATTILCSAGAPFGMRLSSTRDELGVVVSLDVIDDNSQFHLKFPEHPIKASEALKIFNEQND